MTEPAERAGTGHVSGPSEGAQRSGGIGLLASNVGSLVTSNAVNRATSFVVYAMVARFLGARELGQLALATSLLYLVQRFVLLGLETLTTRAVAKDRTETSKYLMTASAIIVVSAAASWPVIWGFAEVMDYSADTSRVILILFLAMAPFALMQLTEATFVAWERSKYVALSNSPIWIVQTGVAFAILNSGHGVDMVALSIVVAYTTIAAVHWLLLVTRVTRLSARVHVHFVPSMLKSSMPFLGIDGMNAIRGAVNVIFLSRFAGEVAVGVFVAARQLLVPLYLIFQAIGQGVFPAMVRQFESGKSRLGRLSGRLVEFTITLAIPAVTLLFVLAGSILLFVYSDPDFLESVVVLRILVWSMLGVALTAILGRILWATQREALSFRIALTNTIILVATSFVLVREFDVVGAALASMTVGILNVVQHYVPLWRLFGRFDIIKWVWKPAVAASVMAGVLLATPGMQLWLRISAGAVVYLSALFLLHILGAGGYTQLRKQLRSVSGQA